jgi:S-adenosylmethionine decarboxylase
MDGTLVVGRHLIVELGGCDRARLDDAEVIRALIRAGAEAAGTQLLSEVVHRFTPAGVTGLGLLAESHLAVHTWPEHGYAAVDLLTCRPDGALDVDAVVACLRSLLGARDASFKLVERRLP